MSVDFCGCPLCWTLTAPVGEEAKLDAADATGPAPSGYVSNRSCEVMAPEFPAREVGAGQPTVFDLVKADLDERDRIGAAQHGGKPLFPLVCKREHEARRHWIAAPGSHCDPPTGCFECSCPGFQAGRDFMREAYEEALDLCVYLRGALAKREAKK
jgi:hypothetical protein